MFRFKPLVEADIKKFIEKIISGEKLRIDSKAIEAIIYLSEGDLRKVANYLQASAAAGEKITEDIVYDVSSRAKPSDVRDMMELALKGKFVEARKKLQELLLVQGLGGSDIISEIHRQIYSLDGLSEESKVRLIDKCGEYEFRISEGGNELIQLEAMLAQFMLVK
jgi:replication factor C small subunit